MSEKSWPFHDGAKGTPVLEDEWSVMARQWASSGVVLDVSADALKVVGDGSGLQVKVLPGRASVRGHWYDLSDEKVVSIAPNTAGNPRADLVVLRLDPSRNTIELTTKQGQPAGSPTPADPIESDLGIFEMPLAVVRVPNNATTVLPSQITDVRVSTGLPIVTCTSKTRPDPRRGLVIVEIDTGRMLVGDGADFKDTLTHLNGNLTVARQNPQIVLNHTSTSANPRSSYYYFHDNGAVRWGWVHRLTTDTGTTVNRLELVRYATDGTVNAPIKVASDGSIDLTSAGSVTVPTPTTDAHAARHATVKGWTRTGYTARFQHSTGTTSSVEVLSSDGANGMRVEANDLGAAMYLKTDGTWRGKFLTVNQSGTKTTVGGGDGSKVTWALTGTFRGTFNPARFTDAKHLDVLRWVKPDGDDPASPSEPALDLTETCVALAEQVARLEARLALLEQS